MVSEGERPVATRPPGDWLDLSPRQVVGDGRGGAIEIHFGPLPLQGGQPSSWLRVVNLAPHQLGKLWLMNEHSVCYQLDSRVDGIGRATTAGEFLQAMARMDGWDGLVVDLRGLSCMRATTQVLCGVVKMPLDQGRLCHLQLSWF
ncbi:hypothetical protein BurJ1DRAFT_3457 [Burkholderiales bacterium JOSHI_001]|nr:hypothetical protein BurJ1DRAFT_3457 [Burkholderiales bacterium JOSHI_001]